MFGPGVDSRRWMTASTPCRRRGQAGQVQRISHWLLPHRHAEVRTEEGRFYMFVAIDRSSKFVLNEMHENSRTATSRDFLLRLIEVVPYKVHTVLTDNV